MKKIILLMTMLSVVLVLGGCQSDKKITNISDTPVIDTGDKEVDIPKGITVNEIKFEKVSIESLDEKTQEILNNSKIEKGYKLIKENTGTNYYLAVFSGEKSTTGYSIEVIKVEDNEGKTNVTVEEASPSKDSMNGQMITYPMDIVKLSGITEDITINYIKNEDITDSVDINSPVGNDEPADSTLIKTEKITVTYNGQIDNNSIEVNLNGETKELRLRDVSSEELKLLNPQTGDTLDIEIFKNEYNQDTVYTFITEQTTPGKKVVQTVEAEYVGQIDGNSIEVKIEDGTVSLRLTDMAKKQIIDANFEIGDIVRLETFQNDYNQQTVQFIEKSK